MKDFASKGLIEVLTPLDLEFDWEDLSAFNLELQAEVSFITGHTWVSASDFFVTGLVSATDFSVSSLVSASDSCATCTSSTEKG